MLISTCALTFCKPAVSARFSFAVARPQAQLCDGRFLFLILAPLFLDFLVLFQELIEGSNIALILLVADRFGNRPWDYVPPESGYTSATSSAIRPKASVCVNRAPLVMAESYDRLERVNPSLALSMGLMSCLYRREDTLPRPSLPVLVIVTESGSVPTMGCMLE